MQWRSFGWFDKPEDSENWCIVYTHNRDSGTLTKSNALEIAEALQPFEDSGDITPEDHSHFLCGWVKGFAIRVRDGNGNITQAFAAYAELLERLEAYPILSEERTSQMESDDEIESWKSYGRWDFQRALLRSLEELLPEEKWVDQVRDNVNNWDDAQIDKAWEYAREWIGWDTEHTNEGCRFNIRDAVIRWIEDRFA